METLIVNIQTTAIFIGVLSILILVHEWGHFITAKRLGITVEKFALGFGPTVYAKTVNGTRYLINAVPLGGYVKMAGDERSECRGKPEEFYSRPAGHRAAVIINGPLVNFIFAYLCLFIVFMAGYPDLSGTVGEVLEDYPARQAGVEAGDRIVGINEMPTQSWTQVQQAITESTTAQIHLRIVRGGEESALSITPKIERVRTIFGGFKELRLIGIRPSEEIILLKYGPGTAVFKAGEELTRITTMTYKAIFSMMTGAMSVKENVTGPIGIFYIVKKAAEMGLSHLVFIMGVISASLAIFNLLPIIPLDGGHLFLLGIEKIRGRTLPPKVDEYIVKIGFGLIVGMALFVFYSDFARFGWLDKIKQWFP